MATATRVGSTVSRHSAQGAVARVAVSRAAERSTLLAVDVAAQLLGGACILGVDSDARTTTAGCTAGCVLSLGTAGLYRSGLRLSCLDDAPRLVCAAIAGASVALAVVWSVCAPAVRATTLACALTASIGAVVFGRAIGYAAVRSARTRRLGRPALVVGTGGVAAQLVRRLLDEPAYGLRPVGQLSGGARPGETPLPVLGTAAQLPALVESTGAGHVLVAYSEDGEADLVEVLRGIRRDDVDVLCVPRMFEIHPRTAAAEQVGPIPLVRLSRARRGPAARAVKRLIDVAVAATALVALCPLFALCALAVRIECGPGVIFRQDRVGRDGRRFTLFKFRSLRPADEHESATRWSVAGDARIGPVGRVLRRTSLDELPQLVNILRGEMSLVGPRPERPHFVAEFSDRYSGYRHRHRAEVGLTGWSQVNGLRGSTSIAERAVLDNWYIENWSLWLDLTIVLRTVAAVLRDARGARL